MESKWLVIDTEHERYNRIAEGTYTVHMFKLDSTATQDEYDRAAELDALDELNTQFSMITNVTGNLLDN